jgi:hypothetical protein
MNQFSHGFFGIAFAHTSESPNPLTTDALRILGSAAKFRHYAVSSRLVNVHFPAMFLREPFNRLFP